MGLCIDQPARIQQNSLLFLESIHLCIDVVETSPHLKEAYASYRGVQPGALLRLC